MSHRARYEIDIYFYVTPYLEKQFYYFATLATMYGYWLRGS